MKKRFALLAALLLLFTAFPAPAEESPAWLRVSPVLCNPSPSPEAAALMEWMCENYGTRMISGQYLDEGRRGQELLAIAGVTGGLYPALVGLDVMNYSPSSIALGTHLVTVDQAINYWREGYIVTLCWHWRPDVKYMDTAGTGWWGGFYTENTTFDLGKALSGEDPEGYDLLIRDIDAIAGQLARLRDAGVPVLWRPLHEASGGWFWWGASGKDAYLQLYHLLFDRLTNEYGLNNLIWIWNAQSPAWYPGDDEVDIIGTDIYPGERVYDPQSAAFLQLARVTDTRKMIILSENGCVPDPELAFRNGTVWGSWCTWGGEFVLKSNKFNKPSEQYTESKKLKEFYADERVVKRADIPDLKGSD